MREYLLKTKKVGDTVAIMLPKELLMAEQIGADMVVKVTVQRCQKTNSSATKDCSLGPDDPWKMLE